MILAYILGAVSKLTRLSPSTVDIGISTDTFVPRSLHSFVSSSLRPSLPRSSLVPYIPSSLRLFVPLSLVRPSFPTFLRLFVPSSLSPSFVPRSLHSFVSSSLRLFVPLSLVRPSFPTFLCPISGLGVCPVGGCKMCPDDWLYFSFPDYGPGGMYGHYCYKNHPTSSTWTTANDNCNVLSFNPWKVLS